MNPATLTLAATRGALQRGEVSSTELTELFLQRIAQYDPSINSFITVTADAAREQAKRAEQARASAQESGALLGIPLALKDLFDTKGVRTTAGSKILRDNVPSHDAAVATRLNDAGAVLLGKNNMHEFAFGVTNENPHFGDAHNPWALDHITGGSSGGSAAAVSARLCLGAIGSDTGGSIRIPAALCGVTGLKPSYGRVSLRGAIPLSWSNDHAGPLTQNAQDAALLLTTIAGYDPDDPVSENIPSTDFTALLPESLHGIRFAAPRGYFEADVNAEILTAVREAERVFAGLGAVGVENDLSFAEEMYDLNRIILRAEAAAYHSQWLKMRSEDYGKDVITRLQNGQRVTAEEYILARRRQSYVRRELKQYFQDVEFVITPTTRVPAPHIGTDPVTMAQHLTAFTAPFDVTGFPAISLPCGFTHEGLPIGLQIIGRAWDEARILQVAHQYQRVTDWHTRIPTAFNLPA